MDIEKRQYYEKLIDGVIKGEDVSATIGEILQIREREVLETNQLDPDFCSYIPADEPEQQ